MPSARASAGTASSSPQRSVLEKRSLVTGSDAFKSRGSGYSHETDSGTGSELEYLECALNPAMSLDGSGSPCQHAEHWNENDLQNHC